MPKETNVLVFTPLVPSASADETARVLSIALHAVMTVVIAGEQIDLDNSEQMRRVTSEAFISLSDKVLKLHPSGSDAIGSILEVAELLGLSAVPWLAERTEVVQ